MKSKQKKLLIAMTDFEFDQYVTQNLPEVQYKETEGGGSELGVDTDGKFILSLMFDRVYDARTVAALTDKQRDILPKAKTKGRLTQKDKAAIILMESLNLALEEFKNE